MVIDCNIQEQPGTEKGQEGPSAAAPANPPPPPSVTIVVVDIAITTVFVFIIVQQKSDTPQG